jgi:hypothetical protein
MLVVSRVKSVRKLEDHIEVAETLDGLIPAEEPT